MPEIDKLAWLHLHQRKLLAARSRGKDAFYIPGGKREPGESDEQALLREIKEELSVDLVPETLSQVGVFRAAAHGKTEDTAVKMTCYRADYSGELRADSEIAELAWLSHRDKHRCSAVTAMILDWLKAEGWLD